jgi:hypothetical protein
LREEQPVLAARMFSLSCGEEGREMRQPLLTAGHQIPRGERVGEFLQAIGSCARRFKSEVQQCSIDDMAE